MVVNGGVVDWGRFEEDEEGIGIASDGARSKGRVFSSGAAARHLQSAKAHTDKNQP